MDIDYCHYHYLKPATWSCSNCARLFGDCCISTEEANIKQPRCCLCSSSLVSLGAANTVEPFWNDIHRFLVYPFKVGPLMLIIAMSMLGMLVSMSLLGAAIVIFIMIVTVRFAYAIIEAAHKGRTTPPNLSILFTADEDRLFIKQIAVFILVGTVIGVVQSTNSTALQLITVGFFMLAMPASILMLAIEKRVTAAINPILLTQLMFKMGTGYLVLYAFVNILSSGPGVVFEYFQDSIPEHLFIPIYIGINIYFWFVTAYLMGYAVLQYQKQLGYKANMENEPSDFESSNRLEADALEKEINILLIEGRYDDVYKILQKTVQRTPNDLRLQTRFNHLLAEMQKRDELVSHSNELIYKLVKNNSISKAAEIYINTLKTVQDYKINSAENMDKLSDYFQITGQHKMALVLISQLSKEYSDYNELPHAILRAIRIYAENLNQPERALPIIKHLLDKKETPEPVKEAALKIRAALST